MPKASVTQVVSAIVFLFPLVSACGGSVVGIGEFPDAGHSEDSAPPEDTGRPDDANHPVDSASCGFPEVCCGFVNGCETEIGAAVCSGDEWTCPTGGSPAAGCSAICVSTPPEGGPKEGGFSFDAGEGGFSFDAGEGGFSFDSGEGGFFFDAGEGGFFGDSGSDADAAFSTEFSCGDNGVLCDSTTQYCSIQQGGVAGFMNASCEEIPVECLPPNVSCACIKQHSVSGGGQCVDDAGEVTVTVDVP